MANDNVITINARMRNSANLSQFYIFGLCIYYTITQFTIPFELYNSVFTILFTLHWLFLWPLIYSALSDLIFLEQQYGKTLHIKQFELLLPSNNRESFALKIIKIMNLFILMIEMYFIIYFTPLNTNTSSCDIYANIFNICIAMKIVTVHGYIHWLCFILSLFPVCCLFCTMPCIICNDYSKNEQKRLYHMNIQIRYLKFMSFTIYIPISLRPPIIINIMPCLYSRDPPIDKTCAICFSTSSIFDTWKELSCNHKFHPKCIDKWLLIRASCPLCRSAITNNDDMIITINNTPISNATIINVIPVISLGESSLVDINQQSINVSIDDLVI